MLPIPSPRMPESVDPHLVFDAQAAIPGLRVHSGTGNEESGHGVMFGDVDGYGRVAVKPHHRESRLYREIDSIHGVRELGIATPDIVDIAPGKQATYLVTGYEEMRTLGEHEWYRDVADPKIKRIFADLGHAANALAMLHGVGVTHGDFQPKNIAFRGADDEYVAIDLERTQLGMHGKKGTVEGSKDLYMAAALPLSRGLLHEKSPGYKTKAVVEEMVDKYQAAANHDRKRAVAVDYELVKRAIAHTARTGNVVNLAGPAASQPRQRDSR